MVVPSCWATSSTVIIGSASIAFARLTWTSLKPLGRPPRRLAPRTLASPVWVRSNSPTVCLHPFMSHYYIT